ncbi:MAG: phosphoribosylaminoimidazolecarboxamide formyltransferase [Planctomycetota bacterium]
MPEIALKYGLNPQQPSAVLRYDGPGPMPLRVVNGNPSMINLLDALSAWRLVRELDRAFDLPSATSFKHVSPAGAAIGRPVTPELCAAHFYPSPNEFDYSPLASAYARARSADRSASFGDFVAVSRPVDLPLARLLKTEVSDGIIAPGYDTDALEILTAKQRGGYRVLEIDPAYEPDNASVRTTYGLTLESTDDLTPITHATLGEVVTAQANRPAEAADALVAALVTLRYTQSNSVALGWDGQLVGIGAGQQSRIACTRLACDKAERFFLKMHPKTRELVSRFPAGLPKTSKVNLIDAFVRYDELGELELAELAKANGGATPEAISSEESRQWVQGFEGLGIASDGFFPFRDNLDRAARTGVKHVAQPGGSTRDDELIAAADEHGMTMSMTGLRLFTH